MRRLTGSLIQIAWLVSIGIILYAAQLWEATELFRDFRGILYFLGWCAWISLPFLLLWILNRKLAVTPLLEKLLLIATLPGALLPAWLYIQAVFIDRASTSVLAFAAVPAYQLLFVGLVAIACFILWRRRCSADRGQQSTDD